MARAPFHAHTGDMDATPVCDILPGVNAEDSSNSWEWIAQDHSLHGWGFLFSLGCLAALKPVRDACNLQGSLDSGVAPPESGDGHWDNAQSHIKSQEQA